MNNVSLQVADAIAFINFNQPGGKLNVLNREMWNDLEQSISDLSQYHDLRGLMLESAKPGIFIAGADLKELASMPDEGLGSTRQFIEQGLRALSALENLPFPTMACMDGAALGGGLEVALACDFRLSGTNPKARFGLPEVSLGLIPGWGGTQRLPRIVGPTSAIEMLLNSLQLDPETARFRGLISHIFPSDLLRDQAQLLLVESKRTESWRDQRARKRQPLPIDQAPPTFEEINEGNLSEGKVNAMSLSPDALSAFRNWVAEQSGLSRKAARTTLDVVEKGCLLPLDEALKLETNAFLQLAASPEARQLIAEFFASRKK